MHRWQIVNTWNGGAGGRVVVFTSKAEGNAGHNECFAWIHRTTPFSFAEATARQGYAVEPYVPPRPAVVLARAQWYKIPKDFRGRMEDGTLSAFAACLPKGSTTETGTTLVPVILAASVPRKKAGAR